MQVFLNYKPEAPSLGFFGTFTPVKITEAEFNKAYETCAKTIQTAKNKEQVSAAFQKVLQDLGLNLPEYQILMEKPYNDVASIASGTDLILSENITEFTLNFNTYLSAENILTLDEAQEIQDKTLANETPNNIFKAIQEFVLKSFRPTPSSESSSSSSSSSSPSSSSSSSSSPSSSGSGGGKEPSDEKQISKASTKPKDESMSTATMLLLLGGSALAVGGLIYFAKKNKSPKSK